MISVAGGHCCEIWATEIIKSAEKLLVGRVGHVVRVDQEFLADMDEVGAVSLSCRPCRLPPEAIACGLWVLETLYPLLTGDTPVALEATAGKSLVCHVCHVCQVRHVSTVNFKYLTQYGGKCLRLEGEWR